MHKGTSEESSCFLGEWHDDLILELRNTESKLAFDVFSTLEVHRFRMESESRGLTKDYEYSVCIQYVIRNQFSSRTLGII